MDPVKIADIALKFDSMFDLDFIRTITDLTHECEVFGSTVEFPPMSPPRVVKPAFTDLNQIVNGGINLEGSRFFKYLDSYKIIKERTSTPLIASLTGPLTILGSLIPYSKLKNKLENKEYLEIENGIKITSNLSLTLIDKLNSIAPEILMISDPLACFLDPGAFEKLLIPYYNMLFGKFSGCTILHICGDITCLLPLMDKIHCSGVSVDEKVSITEAISNIPKSKVIFGNIAPIDIMVKGSTEDVQKETRLLTSLQNKHNNFVPATGCTLPHYTPLVNIKAFLKN